MIKTHQQICEHCQAQIHAGELVINCFSCSKIIHSDCKQLSNFKSDQQCIHWYCPNCHDDEENLVNVTDINEDILNIRKTLKKAINNTHDENNNELLINKIKSNRYLPKHIIREICAQCSAQIYTHNPVVICYYCSKIIHYKCVSVANYKTDQQNFNWYCLDCQDSEGIQTTNVCRYNPFNNEYTNKNPSHHYDHEPSEYIESLKDISKVLNGCNSYTVNEFNHEIKK